MKKDYNAFDKDNDSFGRNLFEPKLLEEACKNKIDISDKGMLARRKSERLARKAVQRIGLHAKIDHVDDLELSGNIYRGKNKTCFIYKYWNDPVFHIQDEVKISRLGGDFKERFKKIHGICSLNFVVMLFPPVKSHPEVEVVLRMGICEYGFNEDVLDWALTTLGKCLKKITPLLKSKSENKE